MRCNNDENPTIEFASGQYVRSVEIMPVKEPLCRFFYSQNYSDVYTETDHSPLTLVWFAVKLYNFDEGRVSFTRYDSKVKP